MKSKSGITLLVVGSLLVAGIFAVYRDRPQKVETLEVTRGDLALVIRVTGEVINDRSVILTALVDGQVKRISASLGEQVKAGQVLASMDNRAAAAQRQRAEAFVQQEAVRRQEEQMRLQRLETLAQKGAVSQERLEDAKLNWQAATAAWQVARAELRVAEVAHEWQQIKAPFPAVVVSKTTEVGQWVEAGTPLFSLVALDQWQIEAHVDAVDSGRIKIGQSVTLRCDAFPGRVWQTQVTWIGPAVEREKEKHLNTFRVRMGLGVEAPPLLLGQQVDMDIRVAQRQGVLMLPFAALREVDGEVEVGVIESGRLRYRAVKTGLESDTHVELLSGAIEGQQVVRLDDAILEADIEVTTEQDQ
jgi:RND family efflux transporter MFP subunit